MSATIKAIEGRSVHQIQSGQVISDGLCSAVKELVENSLDAHATSIEIRFKNHGLDCIEVCDNGDGITPENFENLALKHYTSKLTNYDDLDNVRTFGFRGEALSSLCALSDMSVITATKDAAPKGSKLEFHISGNLKSTSVIAAAKGTTVTVENIFKTLPVRRRELERNIKREYGKVLNYLQAYAAVCVGVKFSVYNQPAGGKKTLAFSTKANKTTKENISNIFGAKTVQALVPLTLEFEIAKSAPLSKLRGDTEPAAVKIVGHISRPCVGEGRQTPDRQMFFVNSRPCILPQVSRAFNEIYKGYNITQSPFIFADMIMDTNAYDVNVSPDKRTILLHDQNALIQALKVALTELFDDTDQIVPHTQNKLPPMKQLTLSNTQSSRNIRSSSPVLTKEEAQESSETPRNGFNSRKSSNIQDDEEEAKDNATEAPSSSAADVMISSSPTSALQGDSEANDSETSPSKALSMQQRRKVFNAFSKSHATRADDDDEEEENGISSSPAPASQEDNGTPASTGPKPVSSLWERMRTASASSRTTSARTTVSIGSNTTSSKFRQFGADGGASLPMSNRDRAKRSAGNDMSGRFMKKLKSFAAPRTQVEDEESEQEEIEDDFEEEEAQSDAEAVDEDQEEEMEVDDDAVMQDEGEGKGENEPTEEDNEKDGEDDDGDYVDPSEQKEKETRIVDKLIQDAEKDAIKPAQEIRERARMAFRTDAKDYTFDIVQSAYVSLDNIRQLSMRGRAVRSIAQRTENKKDKEANAQASLEEGEGNGSAQAEERLSLTIKKSDFAKMRIVGQFNLGFILTTRESDSGKDMFIIDQHASDEKYNFERLQAETTVQNQPLVVPKVLELTAPEEVVVMENLDVLRKNGFVVEVDEEAQTGKKCKLKSLPMSKEVTFGVKDLEELIQLIDQHPTDHSVRPSKVRSMFAMRACRSSIMIGKSLTHKTMKKLVTHMGELDKPWNCPHGRPTMRHVWDIEQIDEWRGDDQTTHKSKWESDGWKYIMAQASGEN